MAVSLLSAVTSPKHLIADKAYDADSLRNWLRFRRIKAVIPSTATRTVPYRSRFLYSQALLFPP
jgi:transposase